MPRRRAEKEPASPRAPAAGTVDALSALESLAYSERSERSQEACEESSIEGGPPPPPAAQGMTAATRAGKAASARRSRVVSSSVATSSPKKMGPASDQVQHDAPWDIINRAGKSASEGGVRDTVAARGLLKGAKAALPGLEVRVLEHVLFIPSHDTIGKAMQLLSRGEMHAARALLAHDDVSTTAAFCKQWHRHYKVPVPPMLESALVEQLSPAAMGRILRSGKRSAPLPVPLIVEACTRDPELVGCQFSNGAELGEELGEEATFAMRVCSDEVGHLSLPFFSHRLCTTW